RQVDRLGCGCRSIPGGRDASEPGAGARLPAKGCGPTARKLWRAAWTMSLSMVNTCPSRAGQLRHERRVVADARADLQHAVAWLDVELFQHSGYEVRAGGRGDR